MNKAIDKSVYSNKNNSESKTTVLLQFRYKCVKNDF